MLLRAMIAHLEQQIGPQGSNRQLIQVHSDEKTLNVVLGLIQQTLRLVIGT